METFSALLAICAGNSPVPGEFLAKRPVTLSFDVFFVWINGWVNNREAGDLGRNCAHYDVILMNFNDRIVCNQIMETRAPHRVWIMITKSWVKWTPGVRPINRISIEFLEIQWNLLMLLFITYSADHNEILHRNTVVTGAKFRCDRLIPFETTALQILI